MLTNLPLPFANKTPAITGEQELSYKKSIRWMVCVREHFVLVYGTDSPAGFSAAEKIPRMTNSAFCHEATAPFHRPHLTAEPHAGQGHQHRRLPPPQQVLEGQGLGSRRPLPPPEAPPARGACGWGGRRQSSRSVSKPRGPNDNPSEGVDEPAAAAKTES